MNTKKNLKSNFGSLAIVVGLSFTFIVSYLGATAAIAFAHSTKTKDLLKQGDVTGAMQQAHSLLSALSQNGWDPLKVDGNLLTLPDQLYAEYPRQRRANYWSFQMMSLPVENEVAFYSPLYVRENFRVVQGLEATKSPEGFFIVGWKNGKVTQVPVAGARSYVWGQGGGRRGHVVFPGMAVYNAAMPQYQHLD